MVDNVDLHGKNISFLHRSDGTVELAPMYDVMCTTHQHGTDGGRDVDTELGLFIADRTDVFEVTADDPIAEAKKWGSIRMTGEYVQHGSSLPAIAGSGISRVGEA